LTTGTTPVLDVAQAGRHHSDREIAELPPDSISDDLRGAVTDAASRAK
jgi:hypothetical protein